MADEDDADPELIALLRQSLGLGASSQPKPEDTGVLDSANHIYNNSIDVAIDMYGTKRAAAHIWENMQHRQYSTQTWSEHELHPKEKDEATLNFIFTMDLLNFCFWSDNPDRKFTVIYHDKLWTGYWALVAALQRALDEGKRFFLHRYLQPTRHKLYPTFTTGIPITSPFCWYMIKKKFIAKEPTSEVQDQSSDAFHEESVHATSSTQKDDGSEAIANHTAEGFSSTSDSQDTPVPNSDASKTAGSINENPGMQETKESGPDTETSEAPQPPEPISDGRTENEEVEEEILISKELLQHVFRSQNGELIPLLDERLACLHEAGKVLHDVRRPFSYSQSRGG